MSIYFSATTGVLSGQEEGEKKEKVIIFEKESQNKEVREGNN